ncbi:MAG: 2-hydroxyacid dehydrogenase [Bacteriovoracaceae bacterium]|nr:2-hydroxyacid dehydrogenase [Bacteriovoracaceae bacterium]
MKIAFFSTQIFEKDLFFKYATQNKHEITFFEYALNAKTAQLAQGHDCVCCFVSDLLDEETIKELQQIKIRLISLRSAGFNHVNLDAASQFHIPVVRVPAYSPYSVAEHTAALLMCLNRKIHKAYARVKEQNFKIDGLMGFDLHGKTVGVIGTGKIGSAFAKIMNGFGCRVLAYDPQPNSELPVEYVTLEKLYSQSKIISLHLPLNPETHHLINEEAFSKMMDGVFLLNTGRGALIDTIALINALKTNKIGAAGLDVYEEEEGVFFKDLSNKILSDDVLTRLLTFPNVIMTSHQAFFTEEAVNNIAQTTIDNITQFESFNKLPNQVLSKTHYK